MLRTFATILLMCICTACANPQYNYLPETKAVSFPDIGSVTTVSVGDTMVSQGKFVERQSIKVSQPIQVGTLGSYTFSPGYYSMVGQDAESEFYLPENSSEGGRVQKSPITDPFQAIQVIRNSNQICGVSTLGGKVCTNSLSFKRLMRPSLEADGFQQNLIYSGRIGSKINVGYREFSNNRARPAFNNDVEYDVSDSRVIGYKGAEIEVLDATNRSIRFRLIRNFNTP